MTDLMNDDLAFPEEDELDLLDEAQRAAREPEYKPPAKVLGSDDLPPDVRDGEVEHEE